VIVMEIESIPFIFRPYGVRPFVFRGRLY